MFSLIGFKIGRRSSVESAGELRRIETRAFGLLSRCLLIGVGVALLAANQSLSAVTEKLFLEPPALPQSAVLPISQPAAPFLRDRLVRVNSTALSCLQSTNSGAAKRLLLNLFNDEQHTGLLEQCDAPEP